MKISYDMDMQELSDVAGSVASDIDLPALREKLVDRMLEDTAKNWRTAEDSPYLDTYTFPEDEFWQIVNSCKR